MNVRRCSRVLLFDRAKRVLLLKYRDTAPLDPEEPNLLEYWVPPGGGAHEGESDEDCARRELFEECSLSTGEFEGVVCVREKELLYRGEMKRHRDCFFLASDPRLQPETRQLCDEPILEQRWWSLPDLAASGAVVLPRGLIFALESLQHGKPKKVIMLE